MTKHIKPIAIAAVFLVGCAVGGASSHFVVPPASAQQASLTRWEYYCFDTLDTKSEELTPKFNQLGAQGWEWTGVGVGVGRYTRGATWCFKRPMP